MGKLIKSKAFSIDEVVNEYYMLKEQKKLIEDKMKKLSSQIKSYAEATGVKNDNGSYYCQNSDFTFGMQARKKITFNDVEARTFFENKGFNNAYEVVEKVSFNEDVIEGLVTSGKMSIAELEAITTTKVTYAVDVKKLDTMPEIQETRAALRK